MPRAVVLTALPVEYLAVRTHLTNPQQEMHPQGTIYERGTFIANGHEWDVGIVEVGAGNAGAAVEAERAIAYFQPNILFFVGIAGGIKDDVEIGDVVVATDVYGYESGKVGEQFFTRPKAGKSAYALVQRARAEARKGEWLHRLTNSPVSQPRVRVAPIAAGEKVIASRQSKVFRLLRDSYNDAIAVEMEGFGFLSAAFAYPDIKAIVIRGISDLIEGKNDDAIEPEQVRQEKASHHASAFAFEILAKFSVDNNLESLANLKTQKPSNIADKSQLLENIKPPQTKLYEVDQHLESDISPSVKEVLDWISTSSIKLAQRIVSNALEDCPNLKQVVRSNSRLEQTINWEFEKYLQYIDHSLRTKHRELLDQPPISPFTTQEGSLFTLAERTTFKSEEGRFYTSALQKLKNVIPKRYPEEIKLEIIDYIDNLRDNLPR